MSTLSKQVMRRVYFIWGVRQLARPLFLKLAVLLALLWQVKEAVFVRQVFVNMANYKAEELFNFWSAAFLNTDLLVQTATLGIGVLAILLVRDVISRREYDLAFAR
ncbi:MAG: hypothetical protein HYS73_00090 [Parcubacteria group bacterium]|nr:hypothetical protein [Parcubacteria group bacterium]